MSHIRRPDPLDERPRERVSQSTKMEPEHFGAVPAIALRKRERVKKEPRAEVWPGVSEKSEGDPMSPAVREGTYPVNVL